jgi:hypothetical protein
MLAFALAESAGPDRPTDPRLKIRFRAALREAGEFSMVALHQRTIRMHRLVQEAVAGGVDSADRPRLAECAVRALDLACPIPCFNNYPVWLRLLPVW